MVKHVFEKELKLYGTPCSSQDHQAVRPGPSSPPTARPGARRYGLCSPPSGDPRGVPNARVHSYLRPTPTPARVISCRLAPCCRARVHSRPSMLSLSLCAWRRHSDFGEIAISPHFGSLISHTQHTWPFPLLLLCHTTPIQSTDSVCVVVCVGCWFVVGWLACVACGRCAPC
jgi:hypothetical protein